MDHQCRSRSGLSSSLQIRSDHPQGHSCHHQRCIGLVLSVLTTVMCKAWLRCDLTVIAQYWWRYLVATTIRWHFVGFNKRELPAACSAALGKPSSAQSSSDATNSISVKEFSTDRIHIFGDGLVIRIPNLRVKAVGHLRRHHRRLRSRELIGYIVLGRCPHNHHPIFRCCVYAKGHSGFNELQLSPRVSLSMTSISIMGTDGAEEYRVCLRRHLVSPVPNKWGVIYGDRF